MLDVEKYIGKLLLQEDPVDVRDGLSNILYWGYARQGRRHSKVSAFRSTMPSTDDGLERFMEFVRSEPDARAAERLLALKRLGLPEFGQIGIPCSI